MHRHSYSLTKWTSYKTVDSNVFFRKSSRDLKNCFSRSSTSWTWTFLRRTVKGQRISWTWSSLRQTDDLSITITRSWARRGKIRISWWRRFCFTVLTSFIENQMIYGRKSPFKEIRIPFSLKRDVDLSRSYVCNCSFLVLLVVLFVLENWSIKCDIGVEGSYRSLSGGWEGSWVRFRSRIIYTHLFIKRDREIDDHH